MKTVLSRMIPLVFAAAVPGATVWWAPAHAQEAPRARPGEAAADGMMRIRTPHAQALARALRRADWNARRREGQGRFTAPSAVPHLLLALQDERPTIRRLGLWGLSELRAREAEHEVARFLADPAPEVRGEAARALGDMEAAGRALQVAELLGDSHPLVRLEAAHALGDLQHPESRPALERALRDTNGDVRAKAGWALRRVAEAERILSRRRAGR
jgi:HEAT repeat protein